MTNKPMLLVNALYQNRKTFALMPVTGDCPFLEMIYDPQYNIMQVISKDKREVFAMVEKLDQVGNVVYKKVRTDKGLQEQPAVERRTINEHYHYTIYTTDEIENMVARYAENADTFDYRQYLQKLPVEEAA